MTYEVWFRAHQENQDWQKLPSIGVMNRTEAAIACNACLALLRSQGNQFAQAEVRPVDGSTRDWQERRVTGHRTCEYCYHAIEPGATHYKRRSDGAIACAECFSTMTVDHRPSEVTVNPGPWNDTSFRAVEARPFEAPSYQTVAGISDGVTLRFYDGYRQVMCAKCGAPATQVSYASGEPVGYCASCNPLTFTYQPSKG